MTKMLRSSSSVSMLEGEAGVSSCVWTEVGTSASVGSASSTGRGSAGCGSGVVSSERAIVVSRDCACAEGAELDSVRFAEAAAVAGAGVSFSVTGGSSLCSVGAWPAE